MKFGTRSEKPAANPFRGLFIAVALASGLFVLIYGLSRQLGDAGKPTAPPPAAPEAPTEPERPMGRVDADVFDPAKADPDEAKEPPSYLTDPTTLDLVVASNTLDIYPFYYLLYQCKIADQAQLKQDAIPAPPPGQADQFKVGQTMTLSGDVLTVEPRQDLAIPDVDITKPVQYEIVNAKGEVYLVYTAHEMVGVDMNDRVNVTGSYLFHFPHIPTGSPKDAKPMPTPVVIAREVDGSHYATDPKSLEGVRDGTFAHEPKPFYYLLNQVRRMSETELQQKADKNLTPDALLRDPAAARGQAVVVDGTLIMTQKNRKEPNIAGIETLYWCPIRTRTGELFWVFTLEEPRGFQSKDVVRAHGVFMKMRRFTSRAKFEQQALVVVARRLLRVEYEKSNSLVWLTVVLGAVTFVVLLVAVRWEMVRSREAKKHAQSIASKSRPGNLNEVARAAAKRRGTSPPGEAAPKPGDEPSK
jgi:hypothetical protein